MLYGVGAPGLQDDGSVRKRKRNTLDSASPALLEPDPTAAKVQPTSAVVDGSDNDDGDAAGPGKGQGEADGDVHFWEEGWKERYYSTKFHHPATDDTFRHSVVKVRVSSALLCTEVTPIVRSE